MQRNVPAKAGVATAAPDTTASETKENTSDLVNASSDQEQDHQSVAEQIQATDPEVLNQFLAQFVVKGTPTYQDWPKNVSVFASSRYDQTSGTNDGIRSRTGVYTDALLESAGLKGNESGIYHLLKSITVHSLRTTHSLAKESVKQDQGNLASLFPDFSQQPQSSPGAASLYFQPEVSKDSHAIFLSGFDRRDGMRIGFKDDVENLRRLCKKLGIPGENIGELANTKRAVLEAHLKDFEGKAGDRFVIFYSGHGSNRLSQAGRELVEQNTMKAYKLSKEQAQNVIDFITDKKEAAMLKKIAHAANSPVVELVKKYFPDEYESMLKTLEKKSGLSRQELPATFALLRQGRGTSRTGFATSIFQAMGATSPKHYDGILHSREEITEQDLKRMTTKYLSGFKNVVIISDSCFAGALIADRGRSRSELSEQTDDRQAA